MPSILCCACMLSKEIVPNLWVIESVRVKQCNHIWFMTNFLWYLFTFYAVLNFTLFESTNCLQPMLPFRSTIYSSLQMTQTFIIFLDSCVLFLENSTCFCLLGPLSHLSNVIHSSSNCVFFLPSHKTFEVKFPLWLKDKVEFLACLNMFTVSPQMKRILFLKFWRKNNSNIQILFTISDILIIHYFVKNKIW